MPYQVQNVKRGEISLGVVPGGSTLPHQMTEDGLLYTISAGSVSSTGANSTSTPLSSGATFTGTGEQNDFPDVMVSCQTDTSCTLYFDFSVDGSNWTTFPTSGFKVVPDIHEFHTALKGPRWFRVRLSSSSDSSQSYLRLSTYYGDFRQGNSPLNQSVGLDSDAIVIRPTDFADEVRIGRCQGVVGWTKFGQHESLLSAAGYETVWPNAVGEDFTPQSTAETYVVAYNSTTDGAGTTGALTLAVYYVDSDGKSAIGTHVLGSTGSDTTLFSGYGINRVAVVTNGGAGMNVNGITFTTTTSGLKAAYVPAGGGVTNQAIYTTPANADSVAVYLWYNVGKGGGGSPKVRIRARIYNRQFGTFYTIFDALVDTSVETSPPPIHDPVGFNLSPTDVLIFEADSDANGAEVNVRFSLREYERN